LDYPIRISFELIESNPVWAVGYAAVSVLSAAGETQRRDKLPKLPQLKQFHVPLFGIGIGLLAFWFVLFQFEILANLENILADPIPLLAGIVAIPVISIIPVRYYTREEEKRSCTGLRLEPQSANQGTESVPQML